MLKTDDTIAVNVANYTLENINTLLIIVFRATDCEVI